MKNSGKKKYLFILLLFISIGFAVLTTNLNINFGLAFKTNTWDVHFEKLQVIDTTLKNGTSSILQDGISITFGGNFEKPGDYYEYSVYVVNDGTVDATIDEISIAGLTNQVANYIDYSLKYNDNTSLQTGDLLRAGSVRKIKARLEYKYDLDEFISIDQLNLTCTINYVQLRTNTSNVWEYEYIDKAQTFYVPKTGTYKIELWGAQGGSSPTAQGGYGAYTSGVISLNKNDKFYLFVGSEGKCSNDKSSIPVQFNGGGSSLSQPLEYRYFCSGGGATDIRLVNGSWNEFASLKSRIMVAAGGGGSYSDISSGYRVAGGSGGALTGLDGIMPYTNFGSGGTGGTQTSGGYAICDSTNCYIDGVLPLGTYSEGGFGIGGGFESSANRKDAKNGGGGGYYGGGGSVHVQSGGGGSSFVSGYEGCDAIEEESTEDNIIHTGESIHYSGIYFNSPIMIAGNESMPTQSGVSTMVGNSGNGYVKITLLS